MAEEREQQASVKAGKMGTAHGGPQKPEPRSLDVMGKGRGGIAQGNPWLTVASLRHHPGHGKKDLRWQGQKQKEQSRACTVSPNLSQNNPEEQERRRVLEPLGRRISNMK